MNKKLLTAAPPPYRVGTWRISTKLQRGGKTSGLTGLDNCLSNSDIDFPLLSSQFKDLNLQLHASTNVTNPYTFSIQGNRSFSASVEADIPDTVTALFSVSDTNGYTEKTFTIPAGVHVVHVVGDVFGWCHHIPYEETFNKIGSTTKVYTTGRGKLDVYVQVTPGKTYTMYASGSCLPYSQLADPYVISTSLIVYYSKTINNKTPQVVDL